MSVCEMNAWSIVALKSKYDPWILTIFGRQNSVVSLTTFICDGVKSQRVQGPLDNTVLSSHSSLNIWSEHLSPSILLSSSSPSSFGTLLSQHFCLLHPSLSLSFPLSSSHSSGTWSTMLIRLSRCIYASLSFVRTHTQTRQKTPSNECQES